MDIKRQIVRSGFDGKSCWVHARPAVIPATETTNQIILITAYPLRLTGNDVFYETHAMYSEDQGNTWTGFVPYRDALGRRKIPDGREEIMSDLIPQWHQASKTMLMTGHTVVYKDDEIVPGLRPRSTAWTTFNPTTRQWTSYQKLVMPSLDKFFNAGAGSTQRVDLPNGDILLPIYFIDPANRGKGLSSTVVRCGFDGMTLRYLEHGTELYILQPRGFVEPSLCTVNGRFFLTLRNDQAGYVTIGNDGLHFAVPKEWTFDDGTPLENYNTQQHWLVHEDRLFLVYTRRGADNDNVFRHRAPLFMAEVDQERLCVIRSSELELVPNRGARLGNFGVCRLSPCEYLVVVSEWMQTNPPDPFDYTVCQRYGSDNSIFMVKITF